MGQWSISKTQSTSIELSRSNTEDTVSDVFRIHLSAEIIELGNDFCKYYHATDHRDQNKVFAIIFENSFIPRINVIDHLSKNPIKGLNNIIGYSIVLLSTTKQERLVVIVDSYSTNSTLADLLRNDKTLKIQKIENMIGSINKVLMNLNKRKIFCYNINPSNILIENGEFFAIREFINAYPNFYQQEQYLAPELIECQNTARYIKNPENDIYSLGISVYEAYTNKHPWNHYATMRDYNHARFESSTAKYLLGKAKIPERLKNFLKYTIHDDASMRWKTSHIDDWVKGKNSNSMHESLTDTQNFIRFKEHNYSSLKSLAYALYNNWTNALKFLGNTRFLKWAAHKSLSEDVLEQIQEVINEKPGYEYFATNTENNHIKLSKLLSLIDCNGPIRQKGLALSAASIPYFFYNLVHANNQEDIQEVIKIIRDEQWSYYNNKITASGYLDREDSDYFMKHIQGININSITHGIERLAYSLNPTLACQSKLLKDKYITTSQGILIALENYAEKPPKNFIIDRHIIAFVAAKLNLAENIKSEILPTLPKFSEHPVIKWLGVLNILQHHEPLIRIPNICKAIVLELQELFEDNIHNTEFKKQMIDKADEISKEESLKKIIDLFSNQQEFINDYNGYYAAYRNAKIMEQKIVSLNNLEEISGEALLLGQRITVLLSYVLCLIVIVTVI